MPINLAGILSFHTFASTLRTPLCSSLEINLFFTIRSCLVIQVGSKQLEELAHSCLEVVSHPAGGWMDGWMTDALNGCCPHGQVGHCSSYYRGLIEVRLR